MDRYQYVLILTTSLVLTEIKLVSVDTVLNQLREEDSLPKTHLLILPIDYQRRYLRKKEERETPTRTRFKISNSVEVSVFD